MVKQIKIKRPDKGFKYIDEDLDFIFIRGFDKVKEKWDSISLADIDDEQFEGWIIKRYGEGKKFWGEDDLAKTQGWTREQKLEILNWLSENGAGQLVMIKRGKVRESYKN